MGIFSSLGTDLAEDVTETEAKNIGKDVTENEVKNIGKDVTENEVKNIGEDTTENEVKNTEKQTISTATKLSAAAAVTVGGIVAGDALQNFIRKNGEKLTITAIEPQTSYNIFATTTTVRITYNPSEDISLNDAITFSGTNSLPPIVGQFAPSKIISKTQLEIIVSFKMNSGGTTGIMELSTTFESQLSQVVGNDIINPVTNTASSVLSNILDSLGLTNISTYLFWIFIACVIAAILFFTGPLFYRLIYNILFSKKTNNNT